MSAPNVAIADATLRNPAPVFQRDFTAPMKQAKRGSYEVVQPLRGDTGAQTLMRFGSQLGRAGDVAGAIALDVQTQTNALLADNAVNKAKEVALRLAYDKEAGFNSLKGFDALNRPEGKPLADEFAERFDETVKTISAELKNDAQRQAFAQQALGIRTSLYSQAIQHETQEFRTYNLSTQEGTIKTETTAIGMNYRDPDQVNTSVSRIKGAVAETGFALGKSVTWVEAAQRDAVSRAHSTALTAALEDGNVVFADAYMTAHKDEMTADDVLRVRGVITKELDGRIALAAAREAVDGLSADFAPTDMDRALGVIKQLETGSGSGFKADGSMVEGPRTKYGTAKGPMQVLDGTNKDPGFGVKPAKDDSAAERTRVGRDYFQAMVKRYGGDLPLAMAAYNWGPGNLDDAIKAAKKGGGTWLDRAPQETKAYVRDGMAAYGGGGGAPAKPSLADALQRVENDPRVANSPSRLADARREVKARFEAMEAGLKDREEAALATALRQVEANGGNYMQLPVSLRQAIPADKLDTVMNFADKVRGGNTVTNLAVYQKLTDDQALKGLTDNQFFALRTELSPSDFQHFAEQRQKLARPAAGAGPGDLNTPAVNMVVQTRLQTLGIDPTPKESDKAGMARVGQINRYVREQVLVAQSQSGKKFNDAETEAFIDGLFNKSLTFRQMVFGFDKERSVRMLEMTVKDIPPDDLSGIKDQFKKRGITEPSDSDLLGAYWRTKSLARK